MTNWLPILERGQKPLYIELADAIGRDIASGILPPGARLPAHRNLAFDIGVTVGTVTRAYALARQRNLVFGEVGRGTYVLNEERAEIRPVPSIPEFDKKPATGLANMSGEVAYDTKNLGFTSASDVGQTKLIAQVLEEIAGRSDSIERGHPSKLIDYVRNIPQSWQRAGQEWLSCGGWSPDQDSIVPTNGAHAALMSIFAMATSVGDKVAFEGLSYSSITRSIRLLGRRPVSTPSDEHGIIPEEFEKLCAQQHPKMLFTMPAVQNPTLVRMPEERRQAIAEIAGRYQVWIIEDSVYAPLVDDPVPPIASFAPELTFHVGSLSKTFSAGIRGGWAACPPRIAHQVATTHKLMTGGCPFWLMELAAELVLKGHAEAIRKKIQAENKKRTSAVARIFDGLDYKMHEMCPYVWLRVPDPWHSATFKNAVSDRGITISDEDDFKLDRGVKATHGVRMGLSAPKTVQELEQHLTTIREVLDSGVSSYDTDG